MDFQIEQYAVIPKSLKSDEEIQKNMAPESSSFVDRAKYLLMNGQNFQKSFALQHIKLLTIDRKGALDVLKIISNQLIHLNDENTIKEYIKAVSELFSEIQITEEIKQIYSDICFNIFTKQQQQYEIINYCAEILKHLDDLDIYKEGLYLETDNQMYQILKIIEIYYHKFTPELRRQAHLQIKSGMKHKDEKIRKVISQILMNNQLLLSKIITDFDWIDKFTTLIYDQSKEVRRSSAQLFLTTYLQNEEIHKSRLLLLLENIIQQLDATQFEFITQISLYIIDDDNLQQLLTEKIRQLIQNNPENSLLFIESLSEYYENLKQFNDKYTIIIDELLLNSLKIIDFKLSFMCLSKLYEKLNQDIHFKVIQILFLNYQDNEVYFIPHLSDIINKAQLLNKNKIWLQQLQSMYEQFKKLILDYESKGQWFEIGHMIDVQKIISRILFLQKDFHQLCLKLSSIGSYTIRKKIMNILIDSIIDLDSNEYREQIVQNYMGFINNQNYQLRQLAIEFCIRISKERSRKFILSHSMINILQLQYDIVPLVRAKLPVLLYWLRMLFWNDEKEVIQRVVSVLQNLMNDKKSYIQQISKEQWRAIQQLQFSNAQELMEQNEIMDQRERMECINLKVHIAKQQYLLNPKKIEVSKSRNQTPTTRLPPISKRQNNMLQIPKSTQPRRQSAQRAIQSKSPQPFK